jgi:hypothetical protein
MRQDVDVLSHVTWELLEVFGLDWHWVAKMSQWCGNLSIIILCKMRRCTLNCTALLEVVHYGIVLLSSEHCLHTRTSPFWGWEGEGWSVFC